MLSTTDTPQNKRPTQTESEGLEESIACTRSGKKKARVAILILDKMEFKTKAIKGDKEGHFIILKVRIHQETIKIYTPKIGTPK